MLALYNSADVSPSIFFFFVHSSNSQALSNFHFPNRLSAPEKGAMGPHPLRLAEDESYFPKSSPRRRNQNQNHGMDVVSTDILGRVRPAQAKTRKSTCTFTGAQFVLSDACDWNSKVTVDTLIDGTSALSSSSSRTRSHHRFPAALQDAKTADYHLYFKQTGLRLLGVSSPPGRDGGAENLALHLLR